MKSRKLFQALHEVGLDDCYFQVHLDSLILQSVNLDDGTDETFNLYDKIIERCSRKIEADNDSIMKQALKVYHELLEEKKKRNTRECVYMKALGAWGFDVLDKRTSPPEEEEPTAEKV